MTDVNPLLAQLTDYVIGVPETLEKPVTYALAGNGAKYIRKAPMGSFVLDALKIPGVEPINNGMQLTIPKIPFADICRIYSFFKVISQRDNSEASALIFFDRDTNEFIIHIPEQSNSGGNSEFGQDPDVPGLRVNKVPVMELHSHNTMKAFWSSTDNANENMAQTYMVIGDIRSAQPSYEVSFACAGVRVPIDIWDIIERPEILMSTGGKTYKLNDASVRFVELPFPAEWVDKVKHKAYGGYGATSYGGTSSWVKNYGVTEKDKKKTEQAPTQIVTPKTSSIIAGAASVPIIQPGGQTLYQRIQEMKKQGLEVAHEE